MSNESDAFTQGLALRREMFGPAGAVEATSICEAINLSCAGRSRNSAFPAIW